MGQRGTYSSEEIIKTINEWDESNKVERLGQWFYNRMDKTGEPFPELFYADRSKASQLIWEYYSKW